MSQPRPGGERPEIDPTAVWLSPPAEYGKGRPEAMPPKKLKEIASRIQALLDSGKLSEE